MKKLLTTTFCVSLMAMAIPMVMAEEVENYSKSFSKPFSREFKQNSAHMKKHPMFNLDEKLNLSEEQKSLAKANRIKARKEMKPIMDEIRDKKSEILDIIDSDLSDEQQQKKIESIRSEIKALYKKANTLREKNMSEFEKILTKEQKSKFQEIKKFNKLNRNCKNCERRMPPPVFDED